MSPHDPAEILFAHAYLVGDGRDRPGFMRPLAPLRPSEVAAWVQEQGGDTVRLWDATFRLDPSSFEVEVSRSRPRIIWLHCHPATRATALQMVEAARRSGAVVPVAGPDAGLQPRAYLQAGAHAALEDDGAEAATLSLLLSLRAGRYRPDAELLARTPGIHYRADDGSVLRSQGRVDAELGAPMPRPLRDPAQTRIQLERWRDHLGYSALAIRSARGCPSACGFCSRSVFGRPYQRREPGDVVQEMVALAGSFELDRFVFVDEVFLFDAVWLREFARALKARGPTVPFEVQAHPSVLREEMLGSLAGVGLVHVDLDAASGSAPLLRRLRWAHRPSDVYRSVGWLRQAGVGLGLQVLVGLPGESAADLDATLEMVRLVGPDGVEVCRVDPGSRALLPKDWERVVAPGLGHAPWPLPGGSTDSPQLARDAAVAWMRSFGRGAASADPLGGWLGRWRRPVLRTVVRALRVGVPLQSAARVPGSLLGSGSPPASGRTGPEAGDTDWEHHA